VPPDPIVAAAGETPPPPYSDLTNPPQTLIDAMTQEGFTEDPVLAAILDMFVAESVYNRQLPAVLEEGVNRKTHYRTGTLTDNCMALACHIYGHGNLTSMQCNINVCMNDLTDDRKVRADKFLTYLLAKYPRVSSNDTRYSHTITENNIRQKKLRSLADNANSWCKKSIYSVEWMYHVMVVEPPTSADHMTFNGDWLSGMSYPVALHFAYLLPRFKEKLKGKKMFLCDDQIATLRGMPCLFPDAGSVALMNDE
jgi:hypothetical protein